MKPSEAIKRFDALESQRSTLDNTLEIIERFIVPHRGGFFRPFNSEGEIDWRLREIFDSTAIDANEQLAAFIQGSLTSIAVKWFSLGFRQDFLNEDQEAREWLEAAGNTVHQALLDSNFSLESSEFYLDLTSYGTSMIFEETESEDEWEGLDFRAMPVRECQFEVDHKQQTYRFFRQHKWTPMQIIDKFGVKNVPDSIIQQSKSPNQNDHRTSVLFCVYMREDKKDRLNSIKPLAAEERPVGWMWVLKKDGHIFSKGGYYEMPVFVARWRKTSGSQWGYSPGHIALSDILTLNQLKEEILESLGKVVDPSTIVTERNLISDVDLGRGGLTVVKDIKGLVPYESGARFDVSELKVQQLQQSINKAYRIDQLQLKESPAMTATEVQVRYELMQRMMGPTLGRLQHDFLDPLLKRTFAILTRAGQIPAPPQIIAEAQAELDIEYTGPLPRAQKQDTVVAVNNWIGTMAQLMEIYPELRDIPDIDAIGRETARMAGIPAKMLKSTAEVAKTRQDRAAAEQKMAESRQAQEQGAAMEAQGKGAQAMQQAEAGAEMEPAEEQIE